LAAADEDQSNAGRRDIKTINAPADKPNDVRSKIVAPAACDRREKPELTGRHAPALLGKRDICCLIANKQFFNL
jgi:hypothetical protein